MFQVWEKGMAAKECATLCNFIGNIGMGKVVCANGHVGGLFRSRGWKTCTHTHTHAHGHTQLNPSRVRFAIPKNYSP